MKKISAIQLIVAAVMALAILLGLLQRKNDPYLKQAASSAHTAPADRSLAEYYRQAQLLKHEDSPATATATATFLAVGDIMLSRNVAAASLQNAPAHGTYSTGYPFARMESVLKGTDFNFGNLESPFAVNTTAIIGGQSLVFGAPTSFVAGLQDFNFKILNLANNHALDQGVAGLRATESVLDEAGIRHTGTGSTLDEAWQPAPVTANGIRICFVGASYASQNDNGKTTNSFVARIEDTERLKTAIAKAKTLCDFSVVTMHAGTEYTRTPGSAQTAFARAAIDDGADMVIGAHPHWIQTMETYKGKYIFYSLGNFIFDQDFSQDTKEGLTLKITVSKKIAQNTAAPDAATLEDLQGPRSPASLNSVALVPVVIEHAQPRPAEGTEQAEILKKIGLTDPVLKP